MQLEFEPEFTAGNGWVIPSRVIPAQTDNQGAGYADLWVIEGQVVSWKVRTAIGYGFDVPERKFDLVPGEPIELAELIAAGKSNQPPPVYLYVDQKIEEKLSDVQAGVTSWATLNW